jgi:chromosome segregation ATPase
MKALTLTKEQEIDYEAGFWTAADEVATLSRKVAALKTDYEDIENENYRLNAELASAKTKISKLVTRTDPVHRRNEVITARNTRLATNVATLRLRNKRLSAHIKNLHDRVKEHRID